jgi:hypothetical protein
LQNVVYNWWGEFWNEYVPKFTEGQPYAVVVNGDALEGRHHNAVAQVSHNLADQAAIAATCLAPVVELCDGRFYFVRGTEAHVGPSGEQEELLAKELGAIKDESGRHSRFELWVRVGSRLVHCLHHIGTTSSSHYATTAILKELNETYIESARWAMEPPAAVVRSHRHQHNEVRISTADGYGYSIVTAGWQLKTPFAHRVAGARVTTPEIGGSVLIQGGSDFYTRHKTWKIERPKVVLP